MLAVSCPGCSLVQHVGETRAGKPWACGMRMCMAAVLERVVQQRSGVLWRPAVIRGLTVAWATAMCRNNLSWSSYSCDGLISHSALSFSSLATELAFKDSFSCAGAVRQTA